MINLKDGESSNLGEIQCDISSDFFKENQFRLTNANAKTFILILANKTPKSLLSGGLIDLDKVLKKYNRAEFHHIYPRAYLKEEKYSDDDINCLANFCFLSTSENKKIGRKKPSEYIELMPNGDELSDIRTSTFCPEDAFDDNYRKFIDKRAELLANFAKALI